MEGPQEVEGFLDEKEQEEKNRSDEIEDVQATYKSDKFSENADIDPMDVFGFVNGRIRIISYSLTFKVITSPHASR